MIGIETLATSVDTWECDENDHMNVRFYWSKFADAERHFRHVAGLDRLGTAWTTRHVRYHRELRGGVAVAVRSAVVPDGPFPLTVVHELHEVGRGFLSATAVDGWDVTPEIAAAAVAAASRLGPAAIAALPEAAAARGLAAAPRDLAAPLGDDGRGFATVRAEIVPDMVDGAGRLRAERIVGWGSNAAPHVWTRAGFDQVRLDGAGLGRVAMEMKLTRRLPAPGVGDLVHLVSRFTAASRTTFSLVHDLVDTVSGRRDATLEVVALTMNLETRRAVPLPDDVRARVDELSIVTVSPQ